MYYFDSFGVEIPALFLEEYVDLGSNERIQQYDESDCGAYCLYMIYLIDRGFRIKSALNILVNQCKYPGIYNACFCLSCNFNVHDSDNVNVNDNDSVNDNDNVIENDNDLRSSFANKDIANDSDNDIDIDNDLRISFANNDNVNDIDNDNDRDIFIYQGTCLASHEQSSFADLFGEKHGEAWMKSHQKYKPNNNSPTNTISININNDLQSWLNDDDIITEATFPDNFRSIISGPSECGKTFLLKKTNSSYHIF